MFARWPGFVLQSPSLRRTLIRLWRMLLRAQRATVAYAVLVVREQDGRVLAVPSPTGQLRLPETQLDPWLPITTQVEALVAELLLQISTPSLVALDGTPGPDGVTFLYAATTKSASARSSDGVWLGPDVAASRLGSKDRRLLELCSLASPRGDTRPGNWKA
jgi:hypothetical protein